VATLALYAQAKFCAYFRGVTSALNIGTRSVRAETNKNGVFSQVRRIRPWVVSMGVSSSAQT
jgi:hypothetical protein